MSKRGKASCRLHSLTFNYREASVDASPEETEAGKLAYHGLDPQTDNFAALPQPSTRQARNH